MKSKLEAEMHHSSSMSIVHDAVVEAVKKGYNVKTYHGYNFRQTACLYAEIDDETINAEVKNA